MWLYRRWESRITAVVLAFFYAALTVGVLNPVVFPLVSSDTTERALSGFVVSALVWGGAWYVCNAIRETNDQALFTISPLTARRYLLHNVWLQWPFFAVVFVAVPGVFVALATTWASWPRWPMTETPIALTNTVLMYYVLLIAPLAESFRGGPIVGWLFLPRHLIRRYPWQAFFLLAAFTLGNWLSGGFIYEQIYTWTNGLLQGGDAAFAVLALLSPVSAIAIQDNLSTDTARLVLSGVLGMTLLWEIRSIVLTVGTPQPKWETDDYEAWLEHRAEWLTSASEADIKENETLEEWSQGLCTIADDEQEAPRSRATNRDYIATESPEYITLREAERARSGAASAAESLGATFLRFVQRYPWLVCLVILWIAWLSLADKNPRAIWIGYGTLFMSLLRNLGSPSWWRDAHTVGLGLPARMSVIVRKSYARNWPYYTVSDITAAALIGFALGAPAIGMVCLFLAFQVLTVVGEIRQWLEFIGQSGRPWSYRLVSFVVFGPWCLLPAILVNDDYSAEREALINDARNWVVFPALTLMGLSVGIASLIWLHRKCDTSIPILRTSYDAEEEES